MTAINDTQVDGYYGDDDMTDEEIDLSFLDDEDDTQAADKQ